ncbi:hypothetical protein DUNSADRAFT_17684 [Dunaliella salina]|uniref:Uncharacterized protein n=1 Tax=Dunaliella salina TaxID=3046 RepID=A0ABQ7G1C0_DUNSA|nr:hypothetical protein DUNSADRAFT_17684 [Dunaliella salina]|eukprot:KAF5828382.1 hypothetical protein DUNSADRAFT_17684 [Dunaliella salina]
MKSRSLCFLASMDGKFMHVSVEQRSQGSLGERLVQVQVSLPPGTFAGSPHPKVLVLELWAAGRLVCSYLAITIPNAGALREMHDWVDQAGSATEESSTFVRDLVVWMYYQANSITSADDDESQQQLALLSAVGMDLLGHSLRNGMPGLAGLLLNGLISTASNTPPSDHPDPQVPAGEQSNAPPCDHPHPQVQAAEQSDAPQDVQTYPSGAPVPDAHPAEQRPRESAPQRGAPQESNPPLFARVLRYCIQRPAAPAAPSNYSSPAASVPPACTSSSFVTTTSALAGNTQARGSARSMLSEEASSEEAAFRAWTNAHVSGLCRAWCRLQLLMMSLSVLRAWMEGQHLLLELGSCNLMLLGYTLGALFIRPGSSKAELVHAAITMTRAAFGIMLGTGLTPISFTLSLVFKYRTEAFVEIFMMSVMERVRLSWAAPLRALLTVSTALMYKRIGFIRWPVAQSALVNLCGLGVTAAMEWRDHRLYRSSCVRAKQQASANEGVGQHAVPNTSSKQKSH